MQRLSSDRGSSRRVAVWVIGLLVVVCSSEAAAQQGCSDSRIREIRVDNRGVFNDSTGPVLSKLYDAANWLHVETREEVIRRELLFQEGECLDRFRIHETERLLREFPFLKSAEIRTLEREDGDVDVDVVTEDDWSLRLEPRVDIGSGLGFTGVGLSESNLWGSGRSLGVFYYDRPGRDELGASYLEPQLAGGRANLRLKASRTEPGWAFREVLSYPFVGLVGRRAGFQELGYSERWFRFVAGDAPDRHELILPVEHQVIQVGGAFRLTPSLHRDGSRLGVYGASISYERRRYGSAFFGDSASEGALGVPEAAADRSAAADLEPQRTFRLNLIAGFRSLEFVEWRGLRTLGATEDVGHGLALDLVFGLATRALGATDSHLLVGTGLYGAVQLSDTWLFRARGSFEGRRDYGRHEWRDLFAGLRWSSYWVPGDRHVLVLSGTWAAGWDATVPFQLTLGGPMALRGYPAHRFPGGARTVVTLEDRAFLTSIGTLADVGSVVFLDAGQMWSNGAPFGTDSGIRASVGAGLRLAIPRGTRLSYSLDVAAPLESHLRWDDLTFTFQVRRPISVELPVVDPQLSRSSDAAVRSGVGYLQ